MCVLRKDHHCFITGACVGLGNQRYFITFLFWCFVGLLTSMLGFLYCVGPIAVVRWIVGLTNFLHAFICTIFSFILVSVVASGVCVCGCVCVCAYNCVLCFIEIRYISATIGERFRLIFGRYWIVNFLFPLFWNPQLLTAEIATNLFRVRSKQL
ncbi:unnamed protein product [Angiostrongylus costaricensis]|uniref:Palmitoyltransferase n=1 Tax=Angiostrongylus costaricensis TaxID=334426 RepID=A0A0R3PSA8_ANGCS|nr:unnamed protein product [Angiostrongylus costaricensis]